MSTATPQPPTYRNEVYKGVEIRTRCAPNPRSYLWTGNYSFFTRTISPRGNDRICRELMETFAREEDAVEACFTAGRLAVDREIRTASLSARPPLTTPAPQTQTQTQTQTAAPSKQSGLVITPVTE